MGTLKLLHAFCMLTRIPGLKHSGTEEVISSVRNVIMHFYIPSHVSRQTPLFLHTTAFFSFSYDSVLPTMSGNFFFSVEVSQSSRSITELLLQSKRYFSNIRNEFCIKQNPFKYLNIVIAYH